MKFAIVNNEKLEAVKGLSGICPICQEQVIPKCGQYRIHHWAHKSLSHCDKWWENETAWHRSWKEMFPKDWQEVVAYDENTGEKHIADIKTKDNLVVEFQHSRISEEERVSREFFYKKMLWVVDGTRKKRDYEKFTRCLEFGLFSIPNTNILVSKYGSHDIPIEWMNSVVPVVFDFKGEPNGFWLDNDPRREPLWCLLPTREIDNTISVFLVFSRQDFVDAVKKDAFTINYRNLLQGIKSTPLQPVSIRPQNIDRRYW